MVELQYYVEIEKMVHKAIKIEQQLKRRGGQVLVLALDNEGSSSCDGSWSCWRYWLKGRKLVIEVAKEILKAFMDVIVLFKDCWALDQGCGPWIVAVTFFSTKEVERTTQEGSRHQMYHNSSLVTSLEGSMFRPVRNKLRTASKGLGSSRWSAEVMAEGLKGFETTFLWESDWVEVDHHVALVGNVYMDDGVSFVALFSFWKLNRLPPNHPNRENLGHNFLIQVQVDLRHDFEAYKLTDEVLQSLKMRYVLLLVFGLVLLEQLASWCLEEKDSAQVNESSLPLVNPYQLYQRPSRFTRSIRSLISTSRSTPKEYIQSSSLDQCSLQSTSAKQYVTLEISLELISHWKQQRYTHFHLGGVRLILTLHGRKGLPVTARIALLDTRFKQYEQAIIGTVLTTLHAGSVVLTVYPNFNLSLDDPNLSTFLKIQVQIQGAEQVSSAKIATIHHQLVYRLQNHSLILPTPLDLSSDTLMILAESPDIPTIIQIPRQIPRADLLKIMPLEWITNYEHFHQNTTPVQTSEPMYEKRPDGSVRLQFKPPPSAPAEPPRLSFTCSMVQPVDIIPEVLPSRKTLPIMSFTFQGTPVYPDKIDGHFLWDVPGSGRCDPGCPCNDDEDDYSSRPKKKNIIYPACKLYLPEDDDDEPDYPPPLPLYNKGLQWIQKHQPRSCKPVRSSAGLLPTPPMVPCMMFSSASASASERSDQKHQVWSKPFVNSPISSSGHLEEPKPFEAVLNWQTQNARIQNASLTSLHSKVDQIAHRSSAVETRVTSLSYQLTNLYNSLDAKVAQLDRDLRAMIARDDNSYEFTRKEQEIRQLQAEIARIDADNQRRQAVHTAPPSYFPTEPYHPLGSFFPTTLRDYTPERVFPMTYHLNPQLAKPKPRPPRRPVPPPAVSIPPSVRPMYSDAIQKPLQIHEPVFPDLPSTSALSPFTESPSKAEQKKPAENYLITALELDQLNSSSEESSPSDSVETFDSITETSEPNSFSSDDSQQHLTDISRLLMADHAESNTTDPPPREPGQPYVDIPSDVEGENEGDNSNPPPRVRTKVASGNGPWFTFDDLPPAQSRPFPRRPKKIRYFRRREPSEILDRRRKKSRCFICKKLGHFAKECPKNPKRSQRLVQQLQSLHQFSPDTDQIEFLYSEQESPDPDTVFALGTSDSDSDSASSTEPEDYSPVFHIQSVPPSSTQLSVQPIPSVKIQILLSKYSWPIPAIAFIDTGAQRVWTHVIGSSLPDKDLLLGFDILFQAQKIQVLPTGLRFQSMFQPYTDQLKLYHLAQSPPDYQSISAQLLRFCPPNHLAFAHPHPLWKNPAHFVKLPFKLNEDLNPTKATHPGMPPSELQLAQTECAELLAQGLIEPTTSPWACQAFYVNKRAETLRGKKRLVIDYQPLNQFLQDHKFPLPRKNSIFTYLQNARIFSKFDLKSGFWQLGIDPAERYKTAFCIPNAHYQWTVLPFGLKTAPSIFQKAMTQIFQPLLHHTLVYIDDLLLFSGTPEEHQVLLQQFHDIVDQYGIMLSDKKSTIATDTVEYLGMQIKNGFYQPGPHIAQELLHFPKKQVQQFLSIINYIRDFLPHVDQQTSILYALLKKNPISWDSSHTTAVQQLKQIAQNPPKLKIMTDGKRILQTDASDTSWGALLLEQIDKKEYLIGHASGHFSPAQQHYHTIYKEILAVKNGIKKFEYHLLGHRFLIRLDNSSFPKVLQFKGKTIPNSQLLRLQEWFSRYDFDVEHIKGQRNLIPDFLSRIQTPASPIFYTSPVFPVFMATRSTATSLPSKALTQKTFPRPVQTFPSLYRLQEFAKQFLFRYYMKAFFLEENPHNQFLTFHPENLFLTGFFIPYVRDISDDELWYFWCLTVLHATQLIIPLAYTVNTLNNPSKATSLLWTLLEWFSHIPQWRSQLQQLKTAAFFAQPQISHYHTTPHPSTLDQDPMFKKALMNHLMSLNHVPPPPQDIISSSIGPRHEMFMDPEDDFLPLSQLLQEFQTPPQQEQGQSSRVISQSEPIITHPPTQCRSLCIPGIVHAKGCPQYDGPTYLEQCTLFCEPHGANCHKSCVNYRRFESSSSSDDYGMNLSSPQSPPHVLSMLLALSCYAFMSCLFM
ncbi:hypothetical protein KPL71_021642 [Citrus sinensis]|uniref:Uncharacterized protein n=1 Tax=Citrus sinensis TaxID=2711 RepID=A0ACB8JGK5_CITSI|nr:hypothetical protein KPL71_021642 [Citrus sinensis]